MTDAGTRYDADAAGRLTRITDRAGAVHAELSWNGDALIELVVPGAIVHGEVHDDPLLGAAHAIQPAPGGPGLSTTISAIGWHHPTQIPAIASPGRLAPGAAPPLMNAIAVLAARAGVPALRYAGAFPTAALFRALARSFRTSATEEAFTAGALDRALRLATDELPFVFTPAPHERLAHAHGHVELRDGLERAVVGGLAFEHGEGTGRLRTEGELVRAELWFGDAPYAHVASFAPTGELIDGPHPVPACTSPVLGQRFPPALRDALAGLIAESVPAPLAADARTYVMARPLGWADLGGRAAARAAEGLTVHAVLWDRLAPHGLARVALALAEALAPVVTAALVAELGAQDERFLDHATGIGPPGA